MQREENLRPELVVDLLIRSLDDPMAKTEEVESADIDLQEQDAEPKPESIVAVKFRRLMTLQKYTIDSLVETLAKRNVKVTKRQIQYLRSIKINRPEELRDPSVLGACADLFEVPMVFFFTPDTFRANKPADEKENELLRMTTIALDGPKTSFLRDAIEMAYSAALVSRRRDY